MPLNRLKIVASNRHPWGIITDLDTGEQIQNVRFASLTMDVNNVPVVTLALELLEVVIETDGTIPPTFTVDHVRVAD